MEIKNKRIESEWNFEQSLYNFYIGAITQSNFDSNMSAYLNNKLYLAGRQMQTWCLPLLQNMWLIR